MRNDNEYTRSPETVKVDHARRRLMIRSAVFFAILMLIGTALFVSTADVAETEQGQRGILQGIILTASILALPVTMYYLFAYTPIFKVMPKGEMGKFSNWGKSRRKKPSKTTS